MMQKGTFELLHPKLRSVIYKYGYSEPTPIQKKAIVAILKGENVLITAPTGSGKTEAALFPIFSMMLNDASWSGKPLMVYITPLRALNRDIYVRMQEISKEIGLRTQVRHGDSTKTERREFINSELHWFITTPESLAMLITHQKLREILTDIKYIVVDEIHELVDNERGNMLDVVLRRLKKLSGGFQFIGLSATLANVDTIKSLFPCSPCTIILDQAKKELLITVKTVSRNEKLDENEQFEKLLEMISKDIDTSRTAIIFTNTRDMAEYLGYRLREIGRRDIEVHHGSLSKDVRKDAESKLKKGEIKAIIATSSLELGIDIGSVDLVIQYGSPRQAIRLVQRVGRSGHKLSASSIGIIYSLGNIDDMLESVVIARRAIAGELEEIVPQQKPLDVLLHQLVGMLLAGEVKRKEDIKNFFEKTGSFKNLEWDELDKIIDFAESIGLIRRKENGEIYATGRARVYYYNTTMIPDVNKIPVVTVYGEQVGYLDVDFVVSKLDEGANFILQGKEWTVVSIEENKVIVEEVLERRGLPPSWMGELIPVSKKVARESRALLKRICEGESYERLHKEYSAMSIEVYDYAKRVCNESEKSGFFAPSPSEILIEWTSDNRLVVLNVALGSKGNELLGLILSKFLSSRLGRRISYYSDPYRIYLASTQVTKEEVINSLLFLSELPFSELDGTIIETVRETNIFSYKLGIVAKKMGAISRDASVETLKKLMRYFKDTPIGDEAVREIYHEKLDIWAVKDLLECLKNRRIRINVQPREGLSPFTMYGSKFLVPSNYVLGELPRELMLKALEKRILEKNVLLKCINCGWEKLTKVGELQEVIVCEKCGSRAIVPIPPGNQEFINSIRKYFTVGKKGLKGKEREYYEEAIKRANLVLNHGKIAVLALTPYGVGPRGASRAISRLKLGWEEFLNTLYEEERNYFKTKKYWD